MTQGELEKIPEKITKIFSDLEIRIMSDIVRRLRINGFLTASSDWQVTQLQQLGKSEKDIKAWVKAALQTSEEEIEKIFSDTVYEQYYGHDRAYKVNGMKQIPFDDNVEIQRIIKAAKEQLSGEYENLAESMGFAIRNPDGKIVSSPLLEYYRSTLDSAVMDIQSGAFSYQTVLERTINQMTASGLRWIDYDSGHHNRVDVAARRAVMTGFRQVQGKINEQVAADLGTDSYEVSYHVGARPEHQVWQGRVWTMEQLQTICGLGTVTGLHGANCYHDYNAFIPGVSVRTYTDEQLEEMMAEENTPKTYLGKEYTTYEALQKQRQMETVMRKYRQDIKLLEEGGSDEDAITLKKAKYHGKMQEYEAFSKAMKLPMKKERIYQDGLRKKRVEQKDASKLISAEIWEKAKEQLENSSRSSTIKARGSTSIAMAKKLASASERSKIINEAINAAHPIYAEDLRKAYRNVEKKDGCVDVVIHGTPYYTEYEHKYIIDTETLYYMISGRRDCQGENIRLLSCRTGKADKYGNCVAQELSNRLGMDVYAPIDVLNIHENGKLTVGDRPQLTEEEGFKWFHPKQKKGSDPA